MFRWLSILGALLLAVFTGGVFYFSLRESAVWNEAAGNADERGMPAVFDGFVERWNRSVERELRRELAAGEQQRELLTVSRGEGDGAVWRNVNVPWNASGEGWRMGTIFACFRWKRCPPAWNGIRAWRNRRSGTPAP
ncbi:MAG: hypothetical protein ACLSCR_01095 [Akkermansia sp.]